MAGTGIINVPTNLSVFIDSARSGSTGLTKTGGGALTLFGSSTASGTVNINQGLLAVSFDPVLGTAGSAVNINGGALANTVNSFLSARTFTIGASGGSIRPQPNTTL